MNKVKTVSVKKLEGIDCDRLPIIFDSIEKANRHIKWNENDYPVIGYDKTEIIITWENDIEYSFRLDCKHSTNEYYDGNEIDTTLKRSIEYYTNFNRPDDLTIESKQFYKYLKDNCALN